MPQPINRMVPHPEVYLDTNILADKPDLASLVCQIFAVWARIEQELNFLFFIVLGADAAPAIAIYAELKTQQLQNVALEAAAKAALPLEDYECLKAAISVANSTQTPRNHLAHWSWGGCRQLPDVLALANPKMLKERDFRVAKHLSAKELDEIDPLEVAVLNFFDDSEILAYSKRDLERSLRDLKETEVIFTFLRHYLNPRSLEVMARRFEPFGIKQDVTRASLLQTLNGQRLFREAMDRIRASRKSTPQSPRGSSPQEPAES
jgi:hypothetical protein